ncbi:hypothetical protein J3R30DRAFT_3729030 [Lentinula aciculospora]|uniref:Uncharacterized protein n=1 Tax=Lentinula aciculospora TaxID=153920 RepID=A0A9W9ATM3_9AGAR|nr:hypothetical protein J3R30DRAFT_3729030 [Lentinula aciculospora]
MPSVSVNPQSTATDFANALYVPVHKRTASRGSASSSDSLSPRSTTPTSAHESNIESSPLPIYSIQDLLMLSNSDLTTFSHEQHEYLKDVAPEILLSRRQRKSIEHRRRYKPHALVAGEVHPNLKESNRQPLTSVRNIQPTAVQRRSTRQGRFPERRRSTKVEDDISWRTSRMRSISVTGSPLPLVPIATA